MRPLHFTSAPPPEDDIQGRLQWIIDALLEIELASHEDTSEVADAMAISNYTENRTLDPTAVSLKQLADFVATYTEDTRNRGTTRGS